jgi:uncharacterized protein (DUF1330 family)
MPKGYIVAHIRIFDDQAYARYTEMVQGPMAAYDGSPLARGGRAETPEGRPFPRNVVMEFPSYEAALQYYHSPEYQLAKAVRETAAEAHVVVVEGVDPPVATS